MAQRVASLYAEIGADTGGLEKGLARTKDELQDTATAAKGTGLRFTEMASMLNVAGQAFGLVSGAAKFAYATISEGAELEAAASKFDNLSSSINTTGDALLGKMRSATKGMVSDAELVAAGTDIISLGLAKTESGVVRMSAAVGALNLDMGVLALTLANDSTARLDSLGLSLVDVTKKKEELIASGFIGDAFDEAVLISLEEKMTLLGDASETTAGQLKITEAAIANLTDEAKKLVAVQAGPLISSLAGAVTGQNKVNEGIAAGVITMKEWNAIVNAAPDIQRGNALAIEEVNKRLEAQNAITEEASKTANEYLQYQIALSGGLEDTTASVGDYTTNSTYAIEAMKASRAQVVGVIVARQEEEAATLAAAEATRIATEAATAQSESYHLMSKAIGAAADPIRDYFQAQTDIVASQGEWVGAFTDTSSEISEVNAALSADLSDEQKKAWAEILTASEEGGAEWTAAYNALQNDLTQSQRNALIARQSELEGANGQAISVYTGDAAAYEAAQQAKIEANNAVITSLKEVALATIEGQVTAAVASGELSAAAGNAFLAGVGEGLGLLSEAEADAQLAVGNASLEMAEKLDESLDYVIETGGATAREIGVMSGETAALIAEDWEDLQDESAKALTETGKLKDMIIDGIPDEKIVTIKIRTEGSVPNIPDGATGGVGGATGDTGKYGEYATGGVVPGPMGMPQLAVVHGGEEVLTPAQRNTRGGGGDITISFAGAIFQGTTQQQAAQMVSMVAEQLGVLQ